jgi:hypothetical protein
MATFECSNRRVTQPDTTMALTLYAHPFSGSVSV